MRLFLSYASEDREAAEQIYLSLIGAGHKVFFDRESLPPASDYQTRISLAVRKIDGFIFLVTPHSVQPKSFCLTELDYARKQWPHPKDRVLPVMLEPTPIESVPSYLRAVVIMEPTGDKPAAVVDAIAGMAGRVRRLLRFAWLAGYCLAGALLLALIYWRMIRSEEVAIYNLYGGEIAFSVNGRRSTLNASTAMRINVPENGASLLLYSCGWEQMRTDPGQPMGCRWIPYQLFAGQGWDVILTEPSPRIVMQQRLKSPAPPAAELPDYRPYLAALSSATSEERRKARLALAAFLYKHASGRMNRAVVAEVTTANVSYTTCVGVAMALSHLRDLSGPIVMADPEGAIQDLEGVLLKPGVDDALRGAVGSAIKVVQGAKPY